MQSFEGPLVVLVSYWKRVVAGELEGREYIRLVEGREECVLKITKTERETHCAEKEGMHEE